ncbi:MAG: hypothetical protein M0P10_03320 [Sphaerochaetaceae bacterium]|nr:hypothetical protein [Sphaerochaetaceae bacterium]
MKKKSCLVSILLLLTLPIFSASFSLIQLADEGLPPSDNEMGRILIESKDELALTLENALKRDFSPSWIESYVDEKNVYGFSKTYSPILANILPLKQAYYIITPKVSSNESEIFIRCENGALYSFVFDENNKLISVIEKTFKSDS